MATNPYMEVKTNPYLDINPYMDASAQDQTVDQMGKEMFTRLIGADRPPESQPMPFKAKHPNLYGAYGVGKEMVKMLPWMKYIDPEERERFYRLSTQKQIRELLLEDLNFVVLGQWKPIAGGVKAVGGAALKRFLPKTFEALTKQRVGIDVSIKGIEKVLEPAEAVGLKSKRVPLSKEEFTKLQAEKMGVPQSEAVQKVIGALKKAKPLRKEQEAIYTKERGEKLAKMIKAGEKTSGEKGYYEELKTLKGGMTRVQFESIRKEIGQPDIDALFSQVKDSPILSEWEKLPARKGLAKLFGEYGGTVPTENELSLLKEVFGRDFVKTAVSKQSLWQKMKKLGLDVANIPRSIMASFDLSAPLRQGIFLMGRPKQWGPAFGSMFKPFFSENAYQTLMQSIKAKPGYQLMLDSKLAMTDLGSMTSREEIFMSNLAEKIPGVGRVVRASSRAYTGFLNKLRADVFEDIVEKGAKLGIKDPKFLKDAARFVNTATGRGGLGVLEAAAVPLNAALFSPRLMMSRLQLINPAFYVNLQPQVRKEALKSLFTFAGAASTVAGIAAANGAKVGIDPRNADFMKLKYGNTRYDILGGFQQPIRLAAQLLSGEIVSSTTGKTLTLGEGYKPITRFGIMTRFLEYKEAPLVSFATALLRGQTSLGEKVDVPTEIANRFTPMVIQDMKDLYDEEGLKGLAMSSPAIFGVGVQTYGGVQSYGLEGKKYKKLNSELLKLKIPMGFPSTSAYGEELTNEEYKKLKKKSGMEIARELTWLISTPKYERASEDNKVRWIEGKIDQIKEKTKRKMFPQKRRISGMAKGIKHGTRLSDKEARDLAKEKLKNK